MAKRDVEISVSAKDRTAAGLKSAEIALKRFQNAQAATQNRRAAFAGAEKDARELYQAYQTAGAAAETLGRKMASAKRPSAALKTEFAAAREEVRRTKTEFLAAGVAFGRLNGTIARQGGSYAAFEETTRALRAQTLAAGQADAAMENLARDLPRVAAAQRTLGAETRNATGALAAQGKGDLASRITAAAASRKDRGPLGLRPYELQNLGYQVNDLFTQIAGGTPVMQAFAQQGGQIAQLFPAAISTILRFIPVIGLATAAIAPFLAAMKESNDQAKTLKDLDIALTASGNGAAYSAPRLAALAAELDGLGGSLKDAKESIKTFVDDGVAPEYLERFGRAALNLAKVMKIDVTDAAEKVSTAFTGNISDILSLDDSINFLTRAERKHIESLKDSGREAQARTEAFAIFERRYDATAQKMQGPWTNILKNFTGAWQAFVEYVNFIDWSKVRAEINGLIGLIEKLTGMLPGARQRTRDEIGAEIIRLEQARMQSIQVSSKYRGTALAGAPESNIQDVDRRLAKLRAEQDALALRQQLSDLAGPPVQARDTTIDPPNPPRIPRGRQSGMSDAERLAKAQKEFNEDLDAANAKRQFQISLLSETAREQEVLTAIEDARARAADAGLVFTEAQARSIEDSVGALEDAKTAKEGQVLIERTLLDLAERRGEIESKEAFVTRGLREAGLQAVTKQIEGTEDVINVLSQEGVAYSELLRQQYDLDQATRDRAASEKSVAGLLTQQGALQEQLTFAQEQGDQSAAAVLGLELDAVNAKLLQAVNNAILFWQSLGGPEAADALLTLQGLEARLAGLGKDAVVTGKEINEMLAGGGANAFDNFAQKLVETRDLFGSLRDAFLQFAADFLRQIAQIIAKAAILQAIGATSGGEGGLGGTIAGLVNGLFRHSGGLVGSGGGFKAVNPAVFAGATRYHSGGIAGMAPDEVPAILKQGEEVLTEDDPRHRNNGGGAGGGLRQKIVNVLSGPDVLKHALADEDGQEVVFNFFRMNAGTLKTIIG